jgi:hypothetical protein
MNFPTPGETAVSTDSTTETETETEVSVYETLSDDHKELFQTYWAVVETYRGVKKLAVTYLFDNPEGVSNADVAALQDRSPLAEHFVFYKEQKDALKDQFRTLREDGEIPKETSLPGFKDDMDPDFEYKVLSAENSADEWGINPETFYEDEGEIWFPEDYEAPTDDEGNLLVWNKETEDDEVVLENILKIAEDTDGIGDKTLEALKENLKKHGY